MGAGLWTFSVSILEESSVCFSPGMAFACRRCGRKAGGCGKDDKGKQAQHSTEPSLLACQQQTQLSGKPRTIKDFPTLRCRGAETRPSSQKSRVRSYSSTESPSLMRGVCDLLPRSSKFCFHSVRCNLLLYLPNYQFIC